MRNIEASKYRARTGEGGITDIIWKHIRLIEKQSIRFYGMKSEDFVRKLRWE